MSLIILTFLIGLALMAFGYLIWKKGKIELIREHHYRNVKDKTVYSKVMGQTVTAMGGLIVLSGIIGLIPAIPAWLSSLIFYVGIIGSVAAILIIQFRYNGGI